MPPPMGTNFKNMITEVQITHVCKCKCMACACSVVHESTCAVWLAQVVPKVRLDMVSYSSYDSQQSPEHFKAALEFIQHQHNRSAARYR